MEVDKLDKIDGVEVHSFKTLNKRPVHITGDNVLVTLSLLETQLEKDKKTGIITLGSYTKKAEGKNHEVVTEKGKAHILEVLEAGPRAIENGIEKGDIIRIMPMLPEDILDPVLSSIMKRPVGVMNSMAAKIIFKGSKSK